MRKMFLFFFSKILSYTFRLSKKSKHAEYPKDIQSKVGLEGHTAEKLIIRRCRERISEGHSIKSWFRRTHSRKTHHPEVQRKNQKTYGCLQSEHDIFFLQEKPVYT